MEVTRRRLRQALYSLGLLAGAAVAAPAAPNSTLRALESGMIDLYETHAHAVVQVKVATKDSSNSEDRGTALTVTTGFFISEDGKVLTNAIPEENIVRLWIVKGGVSYLAEEIGTDPQSNISLIQALNLPPERHAVALVPPASTPRVGAFAFAITSPLDFSPSPSWGLVTGFESEFGELEFPFTYTRVSIPVGPAEGGAPIFNTDGELLGMSVAALPELESGYLVPTQSLRRIVSDLEKDGKARYGSLPIRFTQETKSPDTRRQVVIESIQPSSQAEKAGLKVGDVVLASGETLVESVNQLRDLIFFAEPGAFLSLTISRDGAKKEFALLIVPQNQTAQPTTTASQKRG